MRNATKAPRGAARRKPKSEPPGDERRIWVRRFTMAAKRSVYTAQVRRA